MVFDTIIQRNVKLSEAPSYGKPVVLYDASSKGAINHMNLAREILQRNAMTKMSKDNVVIN
jgi:chromosome partitioning protein